MRTPGVGMYEMDEERGAEGGGMNDYWSKR
jgi:hypothetical protein